MNNIIDTYYNLFVKDIHRLWPEETIAALDERVNAGSIIRYLQRDKTRIATIVEHVGKIATGKKILDIGCAYGFYDIILKGNFNCDITGLEMPESVDAYCRLLKENNVPVIESTLSKAPCPIDDGSFDIIIFSEILEHLRVSPLRVLKEIRRVLKPDGIMILTTPNMGYLRNVTHLLTGKNILQPFPEDDTRWDSVTDALTHTRVYMINEVLELIDKAGFGVLESRFISAEKINWQARPSLPLHLLYMFLITIVPSFRDSFMITAKKLSSGINYVI